MTFDRENIDAILILSFGGPNGPDDVIPFLENVLRGRRVPRERMLEVAEHYHHFGGASPINAQNESLIAALQQELAQHDLKLPIYWGNRNWHPLLDDTLAKMSSDRIQNGLCFVTSVFSSYSGCRQYLEDINRAREALNIRAPEILKLRTFFNHPLFIETQSDLLSASLKSLGLERRSRARVVFTAHSIPLSMSQGCSYEQQLHETCRLICELVGIESWDLVYQSRSGPPTQPWLEPDVGDHVRHLATNAISDVIVVPIGFISDHMEVLFDLDTELQQVCDESNVQLTRVPTAGTHPTFVSMIRMLIEEQVRGSEPQWLGHLVPSFPPCPSNCCPGGMSPSHMK